ncbi:MAG TPA: hypothetical protein VFW98_08460 [Gemmatimonadaceae bacterium]|nr:hypothetical protein [Gemmatimonadaceae bacterium]
MTITHLVVAGFVIVYGLYALWLVISIERQLRAATRATAVVMAALDTAREQRAC